MSFGYLLRVPLIFIMDELFKSSFRHPHFVDLMFSVNSTINQIEIGESTQYYKSFMKIIVSCLIFCSSLCLMNLHVRYILPVYLYVFSVGVVLVAYWENMQTVGFLSGEYKNFKIDMADELITLDTDGYMFTFIQLYPRLYKSFQSLILQYCLSLIFDILQIFTTNHSTHKVFRYSFIIPTLIASIPNTSRILNTVTILSTLLQLFILLKTLFLNIFTITNLIQNEFNYIQQMINNIGIFPMIEMKWYYLKITSVFRIFWAIRILKEVLNLLTNTEINNLTLFEIVKYLLIKGCDTCIAVIGMTSFVSYFCDNIIKGVLEWVLLIDEVNIFMYGKQCAMLFILYTMQSGLTGLDSENRWIKLLENVHFINLSVQGYIVDRVEMLLMQLNESHSRSLNRHSRAVAVCGSIIVLGVITIHYLFSSYHSVSPWLLSVSVLNIVLILKVLVSLAVYLLLLINSNYSTFWENIDDYVYFITSLGSILEYGFYIILFLNDVYNLVFVSGGIILAFMIFAKTYMKVSFAKNEWKIFIKRRTVVKKIESLPDATSVQLSEFDDVCAICYQKMRSAKITQCNHFFHGKCLRKWIYLQDQCPLCKSILNKSEM